MFFDAHGMASTRWEKEICDAHRVPCLLPSRLRPCGAVSAKQATPSTPDASVLTLQAFSALALEGGGYLVSVRRAVL